MFYATTDGNGETVVMYNSGVIGFPSSLLLSTEARSALPCVRVTMSLLAAISEPRAAQIVRHRARGALEYMAGVAEREGYQDAREVLLLGQPGEAALTKAAEIGKSLTMEEIADVLSIMHHGNTASSEGSKQMATCHQEEMKND